MGRKKKKEYKYIVDGHGNSCSIEFFKTYSRAKRALDSLTNCRECVNCYNCENCIACIECVNCSGATNLENVLKRKGDAYIPSVYL